MREVEAGKPASYFSMNLDTSKYGQVVGENKTVDELRIENDLLRKHLGIWKKLYDKLCDENNHLYNKNEGLYKRVHELENGKEAQVKG